MPLGIKPTDFLEFKWLTLSRFPIRYRHKCRYRFTATAAFSLTSLMNGLQLSIESPY